jgi:hypothetical protein
MEHRKVIWGSAEGAVRSLFWMDYDPGGRLGLVQTNHCEINGQQAHGVLLRIEYETLNARAIRENGFTLDLTVTAAELPAEIVALQQQGRARGGTEKPLPLETCLVECHIRVAFEDIDSVIVMSPDAGAFDANSVFFPTTNSPAAAAGLARAHEVWRARRSNADDQP